MIRDLLRRLGHRFPCSIGLGHIANGRIGRWVAKGGPVEQLTRLRGGERLWIRTDDTLGRTLLLFGDQDPQITRICRRVLRRGDVVVDVGANVGAVTTVAASAVGPAGQVHAFEPQADVAALLRRSAAENGHTWVTVHPLALSDRDGDASLHLTDSSTGYATLVGAPRGGGTTHVELRRADSYLASLTLPRVRLLKLDVEGHEEKVLIGLGALLAETPPTFVLMELSGEQGLWERRTIELLIEAGYRLFLIPHRLMGRPLIAAPPRDAAVAAIDARDCLAVHAADTEACRLAEEIAGRAAP